MSAFNQDDALKGVPYPVEQAPPMLQMIMLGAAANFERCGELHVVGFIETPTNVVMVPPVGLSKDDYSTVLRGMIKKSRASAFALVMEAWVAYLSNEELAALPTDTDTPLAARENKREAVCIVYENKSGDGFQVIAPIVREADGSGHLGPFVRQDYRSHEGRFVGMFTPEAKA